MEKKYLSKSTIEKINNFFKLLEKLIVLHPYLVVIILHDFYRCLYNVDNYINFKIKNPIKRFNFLISNLTSFASSACKIGSYNTKKKSNFFFLHEISKLDVKKKTGSVYGPMWEKFSPKQNLEAVNLLKKRIPFNFFKNKNVLDAGCGGGRYSNAIKTLGAKNVTGVDFGELGLRIAKKNYSKVKNLKFQKENILNLSFKKNSFDVVFSNGVIHHSTSLERGIKEIFRVCKKGGYIWLYLYSVGGVFWYSRKLMNKLMKKIPYYYAQQILDLINMPTNRFIFMDNWYVPIEQHCSHKQVVRIIKKLGVESITKVISKNKFDLEYSLKKYPAGRKIWGEGEIRFLIKK
jgi:ubiquinone/menaquinone biosynthesis C-methylase UbiE